MRTRSILFIAASAMISLAAVGCSSGSSTDTPAAAATNVGKTITGNLYIDNIHFLDANGADLGSFDSFENFSGTSILCGGSTVDVWQDLKAAKKDWGGQGATISSSTLHATDSAHSLLVPVSMTVSATDADNFQWVGVNWATATSGGILLPTTLASVWGTAAKVSFDYYWAPDSSSTVTSTTDLQVKASVEWNNAAWTVADTYQGSYANSQGSSANLTAATAGSQTITLDYPVLTGADQCLEIGLGVHYVGSLK
jgi:hypothetical protein